MDVLNALYQRLLALPLEALATHQNNLSDLLPEGIFPALNHRHHPADAAAGPPVDLL